MSHLVACPMGHMVSIIGSSRGMGPFSLKNLSLDMLDSFKGFDSTDPRDRVFTFLGFVALDGPYSTLSSSRLIMKKVPNKSTQMLPSI